MRGQPLVAAEHDHTSRVWKYPVVHPFEEGTPDTLSAVQRDDPPAISRAPTTRGDDELARRCVLG